MLKIENKAIHVVDGAIAQPMVDGLFEYAVASCRTGWRYGDVTVAFCLTHAEDSPVP